MSVSRIEVGEGDITRLKVDAIVNAANVSLLGGGGVDGAIHAAAGPRLLEECRKIGGCPTGQVRITSGYNLPAKYVIHAVGPVWKGGTHNEDSLLASCYHGALKLAAERGIKTIAFPAISTGAYDFPLDRAAAIAVKTVDHFLHSDSTIDKVILCCFGNVAQQAFAREVAAIQKNP